MACASPWTSTKSWHKDPTERLSADDRIQTPERIAGHHWTRARSYNWTPERGSEKKSLPEFVERRDALEAAGVALVLGPWYQVLVQDSTRCLTDDPRHQRVITGLEDVHNWTSESGPDKKTLSEFVDRRDALEATWLAARKTTCPTLLFTVPDRSSRVRCPPRAFPLDEQGGH
ncbi:hypothetical protein HPB47_023340 [Ixodes persulcatus]|uniref:Uncharacterized protein n=1 Tax=Ixodes persulcatus TaxID=34615 RepID=A0AC60QAL7_IXOPE|nr:hypothetical protein HPB47_023340 [Ixodes persulcatus]